MWRSALECDSPCTVPELSKHEKNPHRSRPHGRVRHQRSRAEQRHPVRHAGRRPRLLEQPGRPQQLAARQRLGLEHLLRSARQRRSRRRSARHLHVGKRLQSEQRPGYGERHDVQPSGLRRSEERSVRCADARPSIRFRGRLSGAAIGSRRGLRQQPRGPSVRQRQPRQLVFDQERREVHERELRGSEVRRPVRLQQFGRPVLEQSRVERGRFVRQRPVERRGGLPATE
nr:hypothetical protein HUO10_006805 [Paraburkholderia busanensis]